MVDCLAVLVFRSVRNMICANFFDSSIEDSVDTISGKSLLCVL